MVKEMPQFTIDPEFRNKIPPMSESAFDGLRNDIVRDGYVRDPLVVWKEENTLLDGHNRWKIIQENINTLGDKYKIDYKSFSDRWAAIAWICANQLHKHNLSPIQEAKLIQEEHDARQRSFGSSDGFRGNQHVKVVSGENLHLPTINNGRRKIRDAVAEEHGIAPGAVKAAVEVGRGIDKGEEVSPGFKNDILSGTIKATKSDLASLRNMEPDEAEQAVSNIYEYGNARGNRELRKMIKATVNQLVDDGSSSEYSINDLISELLNNGRMASNTLSNSIKQRKELIKTSADKKRVKEAINTISRIIKEVGKGL